MADGHGVRQAIHADGEAAEKNALGITRLVHLFDLLALLSSGFLLYHVRARYRVEQQLAHQAGHDPLTGLAHRRSFETRLRGLPARPHAVVLGTIDRFTRIVGGLGHSFGDHMIVGLMGRMRQAAEVQRRRSVPARRRQLRHPVPVAARQRRIRGGRVGAAR